MEKKLLDKKGIADFLSISTRQVDRLDPPYILVGSRRRYDPSDALLFLKGDIEGGDKNKKSVLPNQM